MTLYLISFDASECGGLVGSRGNKKITKKAKQRVTVRLLRLRTRTDERRVATDDLIPWLRYFRCHSWTTSDGADWSRGRLGHYIKNYFDKKHANTSSRERHSPFVSRGDAGYLLSPPRVPPPRCLCLGSLCGRRGHHCHEQVSSCCVCKSPDSHAMIDRKEMGRAFAIHACIESLLWFESQRGTHAAAAYAFGC